MFWKGRKLPVNWQCFAFLLSQKGIKRPRHGHSVPGNGLLSRQRSGLVSQHEVLRSKTSSSRVNARVKRLGEAQTFAEAVIFLAKAIYQNQKRIPPPPPISRSVFSRIPIRGVTCPKNSTGPAKTFSPNRPLKPKSILSSPSTTSPLPRS